MPQHAEYPFISIDPMVPVIQFKVSNRPAVRTVTIYEDRKVQINVDLTDQDVATRVEIIGLAVNPMADLRETGELD